MLRTHTCGELRKEHVGQDVTLAGWVQRVRDKGGMLWIDLRDKFGITQLAFEEGKTDHKVFEVARESGREFVLLAKGEVSERYAKNDKIPTGDIELIVKELECLNSSKVPPFIVEDDTDGGEDLRMKYRYLDLRRSVVRKGLELRHKMMTETRNYLNDQQFMEVETPYLIKSTPEGARDFVVPSRIHHGEFYALPQSPQTFKQLLMVSGFDRYFQIVKCFRDEDFRADRQPEFSQIDCELSFVDSEDVIQIFEGLMKHLFKKVKGIDLSDFPRMSYDEAMLKYGNDRPDIRFGMLFEELNDLVQGKGFNVFDAAELVVGINVPGCAEYSRKQIDAITEWVKRPQIGAKGLVYAKYNTDGTFKSSVDKFYSDEDLKSWTERFGAKPGDLMLILAGEANATRKALSELRMYLGNELGLRNKNEFQPLWIYDFPLLEWDEETKRYHAMHHPFTSPKKSDVELLEKEPGKVKANAYDLVINGWEVGGGSIRIHDRTLQNRMFDLLGFSEEEAKEQFGFLLDAFEYGAPPHGGIAFGLDRLCAIFGGSDSIRDYMAFPKNTSGRDIMIDSPSAIDQEQLKDLGLTVTNSQEK